MLSFSLRFCHSSAAAAVKQVKQRNNDESVRDEESNRNDNEQDGVEEESEHGEQNGEHSHEGEGNTQGEEGNARVNKVPHFLVEADEAVSSNSEQPGNEKEVALEQRGICEKCLTAAAPTKIVCTVEGDPVAALDLGAPRLVVEGLHAFGNTGWVVVLILLLLLFFSFDLLFLFVFGI